MSDKTTDQIGALLNDDRGVGTGAGAEVSHIPAPISCEDEFEAAYQKIGWWKGPNASAEAWARVREFWRHQGDQGFSWLASRLRREWHIDLLDGVASLLAEADGAAIPAILEELERQPSRDQAEALLKALGWMGGQGISAQPWGATRLELILAMFLHQDDPGLREWAARAARLLPRELALGLVRGRLGSEPDAEVRQAIEETVAASANG